MSDANPKSFATKVVHAVAVFAVICALAAFMSPVAMANEASGPVSPQASKIASGTFATDAGVSWAVYSDGLLDITGTGSPNDTSVPWSDYMTQIKTVHMAATVSPISMDGWFKNDVSLISTDAGHWDTSKCVNLRDVFYGCSALTTVDVSNWDTSECVNMDSTFENDPNITTLDVSNWDVSKCEVLYDLFTHCDKLAVIDVSKWNTSSCTTMGWMFAYCAACSDIDVSNWDVSHVEYMEDMFVGCSGLTSIDVSKWDTSSAKRMEELFKDCTGLEVISLGANFSFDGDGASDTTAATLPNLDIPGFNGSWVSAISENEYTVSQVVANHSTTAKSADTIYAKTTGTTASSVLLQDGWKACFTGNPVSYGGTIAVNEAAGGTAISGASAVFLYSNASDGVYSPTPPIAPGTWYVQAIYVGSDVYQASLSQPVSFTIASAWKPTRLAGGSRYETMATVVDTQFAKSDDVVLVSGDNFPDALSASALAGILNAPVVLTSSKALSPQAASTITTLEASNVYVIGGEAAISADVYNAVAKLDGVDKVERVSGGSRAQTAIQVYDRGIGAWSKTCIVAYGGSYADSLSISPYAYASKTPIFFADTTTHELDSATLETIKNGGFDKAIITGGTAAVSGNVEQQLEGAGLVPDNVKRLGGANRYATSLLINEYAVSSGVLDYRHPAVATGEGYADALSASALCGAKGSVLLLVSDTSESRAAIDSIINAANGGITDFYVIGGTAVVPQSLYDYIDSALG